MEGVCVMMTYHAVKRTQERAGFNIEGSERFISTAIKRGKSAEMFGSREREYLLWQESKEGCRTIVYSTFCFIVSEDGLCITMFDLPAWFGRKRHYSGKHIIRDAKRYIRYYVQSETEDYQAS
jgi:hypothetical protein